MVLDGADPDVVDAARRRPGGARIVEWPERRGFAAALNGALRATKTALLVVLQDDARPEPEWLRTLVDTAGCRPEVGVIGSLVCAPDGRPRHAGAVIGGDGFVAMPWADRPPAADVLPGLRSVDYVSSSSFLVRRAAWEDVGGFDEAMYPLVYVDADFCTALWHHGWAVCADTRSRVVHGGGGSTTKLFREYLFTRNNRRFLDKWGPFVAGRACAPMSAAELAVEESRAEDWLERPPIDPIRAARGAPTPSPGDVYRQRELDVLRGYTAALEARLAMLEEVAS